MLDLYSTCRCLAKCRLSVIQSTRDNYLPAEDARALFGDDTERRQFHAIEARNHSFGGARHALYETLHRSLDWLNTLTPRRSRPHEATAHAGAVLAVVCCLGSMPVPPPPNGSMCRCAATPSR